jgi:putative membrane protein
MIRVPTLAGPALVLTSGAWAGPSGVGSYDYGPHMMWWGGGYGMIFGPLIMILVLALVIAAIVVLIRWAGGQWPGGAHDQGRSPLDILKERYARGEIDREEYTRRRAELQD